jgi:hypothetical protein
METGLILDVHLPNELLGLRLVRQGAALMFSTDQTHLRRYFATLGVAIAAGTLSLAGLFLKLQQDLLVTNSTLKNVTPSAREALLRRQDYLTIGTLILPWFVLVGFLGGLGLSAYGLVGWAKRQKVIDEREDIGLSKERFEFRQLSEAEKAEKLDRDVKESVGEPSREAREEPADESSSPTREKSARSVRTEIVILEGILRDKLLQISPQPSNVVTDIAGVDDGRRYEVDAAIYYREHPVYFELKYATSAVNVTKQILSGLTQISRIAETTSFKNGRGVLVLVVPDASTNEQLRQWRSRAARRAIEDKNASVNIYVNRYNDFVNQSAGDFAVQVGL